MKKECQVCGQMCEGLTKHMKDKHNLTPKQYIKQLQDESANRAMWEYKQKTHNDPFYKVKNGGVPFGETAPRRNQ